MIAPVTAARTTATLGSERTEFAVSGMTCASCVSHVTKALMRVPGVSDARVNLATERAVVAHSPSVATELLEAAVAKAGYAAHSVSANAALRDDADARTRETRRRRNVLFFGLALLVPSLVLGMLPIAFSGKDWVMFALALPAWGFVGFDFHRGALARLQHGSANMDTLVSLGSTAAIGYSIYATFTMQPTYFETAVAIVVLIYLGKYLEVAARGRTNVAIRKLLALRPTTALLRTSEGGTRPVGVDDLKLDDIVVVKSGEGFPIDGVVVRGQSTVDASMLTGEAVPVEVEPGSNVSGGTINGDGTLDVRATAVGAGTALARIVRIVQEAQGSQAPIQRTADRIAGVFVPVILAIAALTFIAWLVVGQPWSVAIPIAVAVLVVACPCAMGLATPMAIMVGIGRGAELGILFKDAEAVERAGAITRVVFDKTGTLTAGKPAVTEFTAVPGVEAREVLRLAATVERESAHPLAAAIVYAAEQQALAFGRVRDVVAERGRGISATVDGNRIFAGTREYLTSAGVPADRFIAHPRPADSATVVWVSSGAQLLGRIALADVARPQSREAVENLGQQHLRDGRHAIRGAVVDTDRIAGRYQPAGEHNAAEEPLALIRGFRCENRRSGTADHDRRIVRVEQ